MAKQPFEGARGARVFLSSLPGKARPRRAGRREEEEDKQTYEGDRRLRAHLETSLAFMQRQGLLTVWHDGKIGGGNLWEEEITAHLDAADVILLLLSPQFLISDFCYAQMEQAFARQKAGVRVIPVHLRSIAGWGDSPLSDLVALPEQSIPVCQAPDEDWAWYEVANALRTLLINRGDRASESAPRSAPEVEAAYCEMVFRRPPVPPADSLAPRTLLMEAACQQLTGNGQVTALMLTGLHGTGKTTLAALLYYWAEQQVQTGSGPWAFARSGWK